MGIYIIVFLSVFCILLLVAGKLLAKLFKYVVSDMEKAKRLASEGKNDLAIEKFRGILSKNKDDVFDAIVEGASERFRAIFLTTITTIFGLLPTVYGIGGRADLIVPIVMAMAYGLLFASLLTLILLPCLFMISADLKLVRIKYED